jgi:hypothetical protein
MEGKNMSKKPELTSTIRRVYDEIDNIIDTFTDLSDIIHFERTIPVIDRVGMDVEYNDRYLFEELELMLEHNPDVASYAIEQTGDHLEGAYELAMYSFVTVDGGHGLGYFYYEI